MFNAFSMIQVGYITRESVSSSTVIYIPVSCKNGALMKIGPQPHSNSILGPLAPLLWGPHCEIRTPIGVVHIECEQG